MASVEFPSSDEWQVIKAASPFKALSIKAIEYGQKLESGNDPFEFARIVEIQELLWQLHYRISDMSKSYGLLHYYFEKGIPDDEWYSLADGPGTQDKFFPHFRELHYQVKDWFDFYADAYYHKLFSAFDIIGHILHVRYNQDAHYKLGRKIAFNSVIDAIKKSDSSLYIQLDTIKQDAVFSQAKKLRDDITHNLLPHSAGLGVIYDQKPGMKMISIGVFRKYTTSKEIMSNVQATPALLERTLDTIAA